MIRHGGTSSQIDFARGDSFSTLRNDKLVVGMIPEWKSKKVGQERFLRNHDRLFMPEKATWSPSRASALK